MDGLREKQPTAAMLFGRCFERALEALFRRHDPVGKFFEAWSPYQHQALAYGCGETWRSMYDQGVKLLELFAQQDRVEIRRPQRNLQIRVSKQLSATSEFAGYIDAFGFVDGRRALIDWKTTTASFPEKPAGLLGLDPQLVCYSWLTGEPEVALVVFVRKRIPKIQYLRATITERQRDQFEELVYDTLTQIDTGFFLPRPGVRAPEHPCLRCPYLGVCLDNPALAEIAVERRVGGELGWLDELE